MLLCVAIENWNPHLTWCLLFGSSHFVNEKIKCKKLRCNLLHIFICLPFHYISVKPNVFRCDPHHCDSGSKQWRGQNSRWHPERKSTCRGLGSSWFDNMGCWCLGPAVAKSAMPRFGCFWFQSAWKQTKTFWWKILWLKKCRRDFLSHRLNHSIGLQKLCFFHHLWPCCNSFPTNLWWTHATPWGIGINMEQGKHTAWIMRTSCVFPCWEVFRNDGWEEKEFAGGHTATQGQGVPFFRGSRILVPKGSQFS